MWMGRGGGLGGRFEVLMWDWKLEASMGLGLWMAFWSGLGGRGEYVVDGCQQFGVGEG